MDVKLADHISDLICIRNQTQCVPVCGSVYIELRASAAPTEGSNIEPLKMYDGMVDSHTFY